ncbi:30S ribosomal protein S11 [bacterium HR34]|nr:30S ribosomal protein S11 [bacterium HR34]
MGKKRVIQQTEEELIQETTEIEQKLQGDVKVAKSGLREGRIYIKSTYNNTIMTLTDDKGNTIAWVSAGKIGFKGTKKGTPFAASKVAEALSAAIEKVKVSKVMIYVQGVGTGRDTALRTLAAKNIDIIGIKDITPIRHGGCRPPKVRRV